MKQTPKGASRPWRLFMGLLGVAGPEAEAAHSVSEAPARLWGAPMKQTPKGALRPWRLFMGLLGVAGPEAEAAHSVSEAPVRLWGAPISFEQGRMPSRFASPP